MSGGDFADLRKLMREHEGTGGLKVLCDVLRKIAFIMLGCRVQLQVLEARLDVLEKGQR